MPDDDDDGSSIQDIPELREWRENYTKNVRKYQNILDHYHREVEKLSENAIRRIREVVPDLNIDEDLSALLSPKNSSINDFRPTITLCTPSKINYFGEKKIETIFKNPQAFNNRQNPPTPTSSNRIFSPNNRAFTEYRDPDMNNLMRKLQARWKERENASTRRLDQLRLNGPDVNRVRNRLFCCQNDQTRTIRLRRGILTQPTSTADLGQSQNQPVILDQNLPTLNGQIDAEITNNNNINNINNNNNNILGVLDDENENDDFDDAPGPEPEPGPEVVAGRGDIAEEHEFEDANENFILPARVEGVPIQVWEVDEDYFEFNFMMFMCALILFVFFSTVLYSESE